jgi:hypothetical protein
MTRYNTLILDQTAWDLVIDSNGNIAVAQPAYSLAQDVASAVRLFVNELWYSPDSGIPYFENVLGHLPPITLLIGYIEKAALTVPGVVSAQCIITAFDARKVSGQVQFIDESGQTNAANF